MTMRRQLGYWLAALLVAAVLVYLLRGILLPFIAGIAVAYFLDPAADRFEAWRVPRGREPVCRRMRLTSGSAQLHPCSGGRS